MELARELGRDPSSETARSETWVLLNRALRGYLRRPAGGSGALDPSDIEDIASEKSLELLARIESGAWRIDAHHPAEVARYLATTARNGHADLRRKRAREEPLAIERDDGSGGRDWNAAATAHGGLPEPELVLLRSEYARALSECARRLQPRSLLVWFFRVFYEMPSQEIAAHPDICLTSAHVDVLLLRSRKAVRRCMRAKGHEPADMPSGTFTELWTNLRRSSERRDPR